MNSRANRIISLGPSAGPAGGRVCDAKAADLAKYLGYTKTNYRIKGQTVFKDCETFISQDVGSGDGSHNGGTWKITNSIEELASKTTRTAMTDALLNQTQVGSLIRKSGLVNEPSLVNPGCVLDASYRSARIGQGS